MKMILKEDRSALEAELDLWLSDVGRSAGTPASAENLASALTQQEMEKLAERLLDISLKVAHHYG